MDADRAEVAGPANRLPGARAFSPARAAAAALPALYIGVFLLYPLARILALGAGPIVRGGMAEVTAIARDTGFWQLVLSSGGQALLSTLLTLAVGLPGAYVFGRYDFPGKALLRVLLLVPFVLPTVVVSSAFVSLVGSGGLLERAASLLTGVPGLRLSLSRSLPAVLLAHAFYNAGMVVRIVGGAWAGLDPRLGEAARSLGSSRAGSFMRVTLRLLVPSIAASALLVFAFCFSSFGVVLVLGGPRMGTLETEIYVQAVRMFNLPAASLLSAAQLVISAVVMLGYSRIQSRAAVTQNLRPDSARARRPAGAGETVLVLLFGLGPAVGMLVPMLSLAAGSVVTRAGVSLAGWAALFSRSGHSIFWTSPLAAFGTSLAFAAEASLLGLALGIPAAYAIAGNRPNGVRPSVYGLGLDALFLLPLGTSAVTLGFGYIVSQGTAPAFLRDSGLLIPISHSLIALPLVIRSLLPALRSVNPRLREAASVLGAGPLRVRREIDARLIGRAFVTAGCFAFTVSLGEFGATALLTRPGLVTLPVLIFEALSRPGETSQGQALALSTILMAACCAGLAAIESSRASTGEPA